MADTEINDIRGTKDFKGVTFSKFKKTDVRKELIQSIMQTKIEPACYWSAELICSGHFGELWDILLLYYYKYIHLGNPKLATYLELRIKNFKEIVSAGFTDSELRLRNNDKIRKLFCEIICVLCDAKRMHSFDNMKVKKTDFDLTILKDRLKAPNVTYAEEVFMHKDPRELYVALNELAYNISDERKNNIMACYWIEWILEFETICKAKKEKISCERRVFAPVDSKSQMDIVWIIWDLFLRQAEEKHSIIKKIVQASLTLFSVKFTAGCAKRRKYILYFIVSLFCEKVNFDEEIVREASKPIVNNVMKKIDSVYKQIKKNEESPGTEYLFQDMHRNNLEKTIEKLDAMNSFGESFVPRL
jgi:hypothetical protein